jgi:NAD(P)-dependent dehydrogenase (short-subunit alcohol dehydrogenase family)
MLTAMSESGGSFQLDGKRVLITGASSGIGAAVAREFAAAGASVGLIARNWDRLVAVLTDCQQTSPESRMWTADLAELDHIDELARRVEAELGPVDVLVNNAGIPKRRRVDTLRRDEVDDVMAINYLSPVHLTLALLPGMLARDRGRIVNVSSVAARLSPPHEASYSASKAALTAFTECMAVDLAATGIKMHLVYPGIIDTPLFQSDDNEPLLDPSAVPALPASALAKAMRAQLEQGTLELYFPDWFEGIAIDKAKDPAAFVAGTAEWVSKHQ